VNSGFLFRTSRRERRLALHLAGSYQLTFNLPLYQLTFGILPSE